MVAHITVVYVIKDTYLFSHTEVSMLQPLCQVEIDTNVTDQISVN